MIRVNLLPHDLRPVQRTPLPHIISLAVLAVALLYMGQVFLSLQGDLNEVNRQVARQEAELQKLAATVAEHNELTEQKVLLQDKIEIIQSILEDRTIWSGHLHQLAALTPDNIWYERIRVTSRRFREERPEIDRRTGRQEIDQRTGRPKTTAVQVQREILEVSGYAVDDETGLSSTATLATNTTVDPLFSESFTLHTSRIVDTEFDGYPVREFSFEYLVAG